ncbi:hypothetical protein L4D20_09980 [Vibrio kyushuensis]|uniref:hypothetical protein n=1 Tax=Vibrio TaxID=662 RepID=UPI003D1019D0
MMNVTPIEIQTASICLDITAFESFDRLTEEEVREYLPSIRSKIWEHETHLNCHLTEGYVNHLSERAIDILLHFRRGAPLLDAGWIIEQISSKKKQTYLH